MTENYMQMKNILFFLLLFFLIALGLSSCKTLHSRKSIKLGKVSFVTDSTWTVGNQIWSDVVQATGCNKTAFDSGFIKHFEGSRNSEQVYLRADCRSNPDFNGDMLSWLAVVHFQKELCPAPWRVPTTEDFKILNAALGGEEMEIGRGYIDTIVRDRYINIWGGSYSTSCNVKGELSKLDAGKVSYYWSQSEYNDNYGFGLWFSRNEQGVIIVPQDYFQKTGGARLRCVCDKQ